MTTADTLVPIDPDAVAAPRAQALPEELLRLVVAAFQALGDPTRARILYALTRQPLCVRDLALVAGVSESAVSHQLRLLRDRRLVRPRREGNVIYYAVDDHHVAALFRRPSTTPTTCAWGCPTTPTRPGSRATRTDVAPPGSKRAGRHPEYGGHIGAPVGSGASPVPVPLGPVAAAAAGSRSTLVPPTGRYATPRARRAGTIGGPSMPTPWLLLNTILSLAALVGLVRLRRAQARHQREVQVKLATLATRLEQARRADAALVTGLTPAEELALTALRRRLARKEARLLRERYRAAARRMPPPQADAPDTSREGDR